MTDARAMPWSEADEPSYQGRGAMSTQPPPQMMSYDKARDVLLALLSQIADEAQYWQAERDAELSGFVIENIDQVRNAILSALVLGDRCAQAEQQQRDCTCWIGRGAYGGLSREREACKVHGLQAEANDLKQRAEQAEAENKTLRDRCAQAEQELEVLRPPAQNYNRTLARAEQAEAEAALFRQRAGQLTDVEATLRRAVVAGSALEMVQQLISDRASDRATLDRAEAECVRLREELAEAREITTGDIARTVRENALRTIVQALEAQVAALTQERDTLRTELLERDDMREGV